MMEDNKYYCRVCDWYFKPSEVKEQIDGISDTLCPDCGYQLYTKEDNKVTLIKYLRKDFYEHR